MVWVTRPSAQVATFAANGGTLGAIEDAPVLGNPCGDNPGALRSVTFTVTGMTGTVSAVTVSMTVNHTWVGDLRVNLAAPNATSHVIFGATGSTTATGCGTSSDLNSTYVFGDDKPAAPTWWNNALTNPIPSGSGFRTSTMGGTVGGGANTSMNAAFAGVTNPNGMWTLTFQDFGEGDVGSVTAASLTIATALTPGDFDGDTKSDWVVVRNTGGGPSGAVTWFWQNASTLLSGLIWGIASDFFVPGDFDGDKKTDPAVWRPGNPGVWYVNRSTDLGATIMAFGQIGDDPTVIGDYDGDGRDDFAVYRAGASAGQPSFWYAWKSGAASLLGMQWGQNGDFPAPGDYDGDGKNDFVVQRSAGGGQAVFHHFMSATSSYVAVYWGTPTDIIVPGDYDGDGKTDVAVVRGISGVINWFIRRSTDGGFTAFQFGASATDFPCQGDFDGDGKTDIGVWRPNADPAMTAFYVRWSSDGSVHAQQFGQLGDYPVLNFNAH
jgi:subtilisin-like proprotein convertase family protein